MRDAGRARDSVVSSARCVRRANTRIDPALSLRCDWLHRGWIRAVSFAREIVIASYSLAISAIHTPRRRKQVLVARGSTTATRALMRRLRAAHSITAITRIIICDLCIFRGQQLQCDMMRPGNSIRHSVILYFSQPYRETKPHFLLVDEILS